MKKYPLMIIFLLCLFTITLSDIIKQDEKYSEMENRRLKTMADVSLSHDFSTTYEDYINDQFVFRDWWIDLKSRCEYLSGKVENNSIIYGKNNYLFEKITDENKDKLNNNISAINKFMSKFNNNSYLMIVPSSYEVYRELLPKYAPLINQREYIDNIYGMEGKNKTVDLLSLFDGKKDEYIYYKTDHHWTTLGAYYAYKEMMDVMDVECQDLNRFGELIEVDGFMGTFYSKSKNYNVQADVISYYEVPEVSMEINGTRYSSLYDYSYFDVRDKYSAFLRGNNGLSVIKNEGTDNGRKLLLIKDSFGNSISPFLTGSFDEVHVVDLRAFNYSIEEYARENSFDKIMILYSFPNLMRDTNILKLKF